MLTSIIAHIANIGRKSGLLYRRMPLPPLILAILYDVSVMYHQRRATHARQQEQVPSHQRHGACGNHAESTNPSWL